MASSVQVVEHVVLFKAKEGIEQAATEAWAVSARALAGLEGVLHLYVGTVLSCKSDSHAWSFVLYGRYRDKAALNAYAVHPQHLQAVALGSTLFSDVMALDWEAHVKPLSSSSSSSSPLLAFRVVFSKWKQHCPHGDIASVSSRLQDLPHSTSGPNFSPGRARGFDWGFAAVYGHVEGIEEHSALLETLSKSSAVEKFLLVDAVTKEGSNVSF